MTEQENIHEYTMEIHDEFLNGYVAQVIRVLDNKGHALANCSITPEPSPFVVNIISDKEPEIYIPKITLYISSINSYMRNKGIATQLWKYSEYHFFKSQHTPYLRFIHDISPDGWTLRKVPEIFEYLEAEGVPTKCLWTGNFSGKRQAWLFLFGDIPKE